RRFARDRYEAISVRDVGANVALVYRYFGSKAGLFAEAAADSAMFGQLDVPAEELPDRMAELYASGWPLSGRVGVRSDLQVLARLGAVCPRYTRRHHVGEVDDYAVHVGFAIISRSHQHQTAPLVHSTSDRRHCLRLSVEVPAD